MADDYNRLAMFSAPADQVNMLAQSQLPPGHPSNMLRSLRDYIPQVQADDSSLMSGIYSRLGRTATAIPRGGLETMANWLQGTHDPNAVRIGEDTIAPLGLFGMAGMAPRAAMGARAMADNARSSVPGTVVNAMDMSQEARMARAKEMGFDTDTPLYHGTQAKFSEFDPSLGNEYGIFLSPNKHYAAPYGGLSPRGRINEPGAYFVRAENVLRPQSTEDVAHAWNKVLTKGDADRLMAQGYDAIAPKEVPEFVLLDPKKIRSVDAAFDPAKRDSADLLAASPSASAPGLAANATQEDSPVLSILSKYGLY